VVLYPCSDDGRKYYPRNGLRVHFFRIPPIGAGKRHKFSATFPILSILKINLMPLMLSLATLA
jgi:hypothetical protein